MNDFPFYVPASRGRRFGAFLANAVLLGLLGVPFDYAGLAQVKSLVFPLTLVLALVFCLFPETPGKRLFNLKLLGEEKEAVGTVRHLLRSAPYLLLWSLFWIADLISFDGKVSKVVLALSYLFAVIFLLADALAVLFTPDGRSLLDMRLRTRVYTPSPVPGMESPKLFGIRIW